MYVCLNRPNKIWPRHRTTNKNMARTRGDATSQKPQLNTSRIDIQLYTRSIALQEIEILWTAKKTWL